MSDKADIDQRLLKKSKEGQCMIMGSVHQEKTFVNVYVPNIGTSKCIEDPDAGKS